MNKNSIEEIMNEFNFNRVRTVMECLNWKWHDKGIPDIEQLRSTAKNLLEDVFEHDIGYSISTGGFEATKYKDTLELQFIVEEWASYDR